MLDTSCLFSSVRNVSGRAAIFGFLPPHGVKLANGEVFTVWGHIQEAVINDQRVTSRRNMLAFEAAIERGDIEVVNTPAPIFKDSVTGASKMATMASGVLGSADPCWYDSVSEDPDPR